MTRVTSYAPGTPCWVDLECADIDASVRFYGDLLGWRVEAPGGPETGGYRRASIDGDDVAALMPAMEPGGPQMWNTYVSVADAGETAAKVSAAGGETIVEPVQVPELGSAAVFRDPTGAVFGVWQPGTFAGAARVNEAGALCWNELGTRDVEAAKAFYGEVFSWTVAEHAIQRTEGGPGPEAYIEWRLGERPVGGMMDIGGMLPDEVPAHWLVYFGVADTDAAVEKVRAAGGEVRFGPSTSTPAASPWSPSRTPGPASSP